MEEVKNKRVQDGIYEFTYKGKTTRITRRPDLYFDLTLGDGPAIKGYIKDLKVKFAAWVSGGVLDAPVPVATPAPVGAAPAPADKPVVPPRRAAAVSKRDDNYKVGAHVVDDKGHEGVVSAVVADDIFFKDDDGKDHKADIADCRIINDQPKSIGVLKPATVAKNPKRAYAAFFWRKDHKTNAKTHVAGMDVYAKFSGGAFDDKYPNVRTSMAEATEKNPMDNGHAFFWPDTNE